MDFIDIDETLDTALFLDPYVIQSLPNDFCRESSNYIDSFFHEVFKACREYDYNRLIRLLENASEPNETNLGMKSASDYGKGTTAEALSKIFIEFYEIVRKNPYVESNPIALCMYIKNFDIDKMSDLITNILRKQLYNFTIEQCNIWGIPLESEESLVGFHWDYNKLEWSKLYGYPLMINQRNILLVPKSIVRSRYVFNIECYIRQYILKDLQQEHLDKNTNMCSRGRKSDGSIVIKPPVINDLYKYEVHGKVHKDYAFSFSSNNKFKEDKFIKDIFARIKSGYGALTDNRLDEIVYKNNTKSA